MKQIFCTMPTDFCCQQSFTRFMETLSHELIDSMAQQKPQLSATQPFEMAKEFSITNHITPNRNKRIGRLWKPLHQNSPAYGDKKSLGFRKEQGGDLPCSCEGKVQELQQKIVGLAEKFEMQNQAVEYRLSEISTGQQQIMEILSGFRKDPANLNGLHTSRSYRSRGTQAHMAMAAENDGDTEQEVFLA
mmetsp:Transcript_18291/g.28469  ORF Transcript_18291/g.28469 Transcript_18291/m.28469 type:complete len:189 (-) Transcript_18291:923-1489(-)